jgi:uncharacterized protein (TIGR03382 family)
VAVGQTGGRTVVATTRRSARADADAEVWEPSLLVTALAIPGEQRNPHLSADWVAFEDLSTGSSQVVLWQWTTGLVFLPHPSTTEQTLNDLDTTAGVEVRAVFAEEAEGGATGVDISRYRIALGADGNVFDDGTGNPWPWGPVPPPPSDRPPPVSCEDDPDPRPIGSLTVTRAWDAARRLVGLRRPPATTPCCPCSPSASGRGITAGWMTLDDGRSPGRARFGHDRQGGDPRRGEDATARIAAVVGGKPRSSLVIRVLADPGRPPHDAAAGRRDRGRPGRLRPRLGPRSGRRSRSGVRQRGWRRSPPTASIGASAGPPVPQPQAIRRCSSGGPAGALALFALLLAAQLKRRR